MLTRLVVAFLAVALCAGAPAQRPFQKQFVFSQTKVLSAAVGAITVQATGSGPIARFQSANLVCTVAVEMIISVDGTAATTTAGTATEVGRARATTAALNVFSDSNAGAGTIVGQRGLLANEVGVFDLDGMALDSGAANTENVTLRTDAVTGTCTLRLIWREG